MSGAREVVREVVRDVLGAISVALLAAVLLLVGVIVTDRADAGAPRSDGGRGCQSDP